MPIIELNNIYFSYDNNQVLKDISLKINEGEFVGVIGPNGSGKSTLMNIILGKLKPQSGTIKLFGENSYNMKKKYLIGYVPQRSFAFNISFPANVKEVVSMGLYAKLGLFKRLGKNDLKKVDETLDIVEMLPYRDRLIGNLSGGQMQRVFIARSLVSDPKILILDEPTVGIDFRSENTLFNLLEKLNKNGITILMVTHDVMAITEKVSRVVCITQGHINLHCAAFELSDKNLSDIYGYPVKLENHRHGGDEK